VAPSPQKRTIRDHCDRGCFKARCLSCCPPNNAKHTHKTVLRPFFGTTRLSRCQKKSSSGLYGVTEDNRGRHINHPAGCHSIRTNQRQPPSHQPLPLVQAGCPSCRPTNSVKELKVGALDVNTKVPKKTKSTEATGHHLFLTLCICSPTPAVTNTTYKHRLSHNYTYI